MPVLPSFEHMSLEDKLRTMEALWNDLCGQPDDVPVPQWHKDLLDQRQLLIERGEAKFSEWDDARKRLDQRTSWAREAQGAGCVARSDQPLAPSP